MLRICESGNFAEMRVSVELKTIVSLPLKCPESRENPTEESVQVPGASLLQHPNNVITRLHHALVLIKLHVVYCSSSIAL